MTADDNSEDRSGKPARPGGPEGSRPRLRAVAGPVAGGPAPPAVRLVREYKGLTVADMLRDEIVDRLPTQARRMLRHTRRGDYEAAERALPGEFATVLQGPRGGAHRRARLGLAIWLLVTVALVALTLLTWGG